MVPLILVLAAVAAAGIIYAILNWWSLRAVGSDVDATETADQVLAEANLYRGSTENDDTPWDGNTRLAPPTHIGF